MISIIIPAFNAENTLSRCVNSILAQTYTAFEIIIVDDGSTDKTWETCLSFSHTDTRIKVLHQENAGVSSARNTGIDSASGQWITFCDADDYVKANWLDNFVMNLSRADCVALGMEVLDQGGIPTEVLRISPFEFHGRVQDSLPLFCQSRSLGFVLNKIFRKDIIVMYGIRFNEQFSFREDEDFVLRYFTHIENIIVIQEKSYYYIAPNNIKEKYKGIDNFPCVSSMLDTIVQLLPQESEIRKQYYKSTIEALFQAYKVKSPIRKSHLRSFIQKRLCDAKYNKELISPITGMILKIKNETLASAILDIKALLHS